MLVTYMLAKGKKRPLKLPVSACVPPDSFFLFLMECIRACLHMCMFYTIYTLYSVMHMNILLNIYSGCGSMFDMNKGNIVINTIFGRENRINAATKV